MTRVKDIQKGPVLWSERSYLLIKKMILERKISSKEPLSESKLASILGISRTPVREALKKLKNEGIIISSDKQGYFLNVPTANEIKDLYEVRAILEMAAVKLAIQRVDPDEIEEFEKSLLKFKAQLDSGEEGSDIVKLGKELHFFIIEKAGNKKLEKMVKALYEKIEMGRVYSHYKQRKVSVDEHIKIANALKERDLEKSQASMEEHFKNAFEMLMKIL